MAGSLTGMQGKTARRTAETLLKKGLIHCIASDAHGVYKRPPHIVQGLQYARKLLGEALVNQMTEVWPAAIINNEEHRVTLSSNYKKSGELER